MIRGLFEQLLGVNEAEEDKIAFAKEKPNIIQQDKVETEQSEEQAEEEAGEISPDEEDEDVEPEGSKEYLGNNGTDQYFYFVKTPNEQGKAKDLQVIDSSGKILFSAEENGLAVDNVKDFLMQALKEVDMANIAFEALMKYMIPAEEKSEEEIEDEKAQKENEQENINNPQQSSKDRQDGISAPPMPVGVGSRVGENIQKLKEKYGLVDEEGQYKSDDDIAAEFQGMNITNIEVGPSGDSGWVEIEFPEGEEHVGGGTTEVVDHWIKYPHNGKVALENWYPEDVYFEIVRQIENKLSGKDVAEGKVPADPATDPEGYMGELKEKYGLKEDEQQPDSSTPVVLNLTYGEFVVLWQLLGKDWNRKNTSIQQKIESQVAEQLGLPESETVVREIGVSESNFGSVEWQKDQVMKILGKLKHGIELDGADKAFVSTQAGFLNISDNAYLEKLKKIAAKAAASERKIKEMMNVEKDKISMLEMKHELVEAKSLEELRGKIEDEADFVDVKPYSHNIISLTLQMIAKEYGNEEANKAIDDFELESLGWKKVQEGVYERTVNEQIPELPEEPSVDQPIVGDPNASQPEDAVVPEVEVAPSTAEEAQAQIKMDYPEEPFTSTALAYADLIFDDPQIFGAIRNLNWDGIYANGDTFIKQVKIVDHYNKFTKEVAQRIVDKFGDDAKYKLAREGSVATYITVLSPTENLSLTGIKDLTNADEAKLTNEPGEIRLWWD